MYSFHTHENMGESLMSYDRLTQRPSGIVVAEMLGTTIARLMPKQYSLEVPDQTTQQLIIADSSGNQVGAIDMAGESDCHASVTEAPDLDTLVREATSTWRSLVGTAEIITIQTSLIEVRKMHEYTTPSGLIVHSDEHAPTEEFVGYAASPDEINALDAIRQAILEGQATERPGGYL